MEYREEIVVQVLEKFYHATGIEAVFIDCQFNALSRPFVNRVYEDLLLQSRGKLETLLADLFKENSCETHQYYSCFFEDNILCSIVLYKHATVLCGAFVTQAIQPTLHKPGENTLLPEACEPLRINTGEDYGKVERAKVVSPEKLVSISEVLTALSCMVSNEKEPRQVIKSGDTDPKIFELFQSETQYNRRYKTVAIDRNEQYALYLQLMDSISKGDKESLVAAIRDMDDVSLPMDILTSKDLTRSLKNTMIMICSMCAYIAIGAGVPFGKAMNLVDDYIAETEKLVNKNDIFELMKAAFFSFTRAVAVTRLTAYTKPVRQIIEYIEAHYAEKITLDKLAAHVGLSESYLSNLLKKETGMNLADHINKARIEKSKKIMLRTNVTVNELSTMVGYTYSNYFAKQFRQFTGMTPTEYQNFLIENLEKTDGSSDILRLIYDQLQHITSVFPGIFDVGRIVDPRTNKCWIQNQNGNIGVSTCYDFWGRHESCETCISHLAFENNRTFIKTDQNAGDAYLIIATPIKVGNEKYVLEILKNISTDYFDCINKKLLVYD